MCGVHEKLRLNQTEVTIQNQIRTCGQSPAPRPDCARQTAEWQWQSASTPPRPAKLTDRHAFAAVFWHFCCPAKSDWKACFRLTGFWPVGRVMMWA